ncbi:MAG TPA: cytochrome C oxidase subunit II [Persephonella sp.]|uniref:Cytochrome c oxidase, subunit II n=1 Tax=Persephonella marina (strain DSM 14350 / EX-H1) TaxID=123214 RepID=C0QTR6_PERMH|nr:MULTISPECIES: cytochrome c oxidase subunit II [Persephonella]ACO04255.1 cytochrome c oxidase, subunit II [Persephonella marina EX-H1]HCB70302.1 cytochrome C oxidase subunit II [Persephonella sp.]
MVTSADVLWMLKIVYTIYAFAIISFIGWFGYRVTKKPDSNRTWLTPKVFYSYLGMLVVIGVGIHILTYNKVPWVAWELKKHKIQPDREINVHIKDHTFIIPEETPITIKCGEVVRFNVTSEDLTYGFGLFRENNSMVFQMQVVPQHRNVLLWKFTEERTFYVLSTEYSGPKGAYMKVPDAFKVVGCERLAMREGVR